MTPINQTLTQTLALYRETTYDFTVVASTDSYKATDSSYIRISEPLEVAFTPRQESTVQLDMIEQLLIKREDAIAAHDILVEDIDTRINELRALPASQAAA